MSAATDLLATVPVFAALSAEVRERLGDRLNARQVAAGEWVFRRGDPGDSCYVVRSGRLEVVLEDEEPIVLRTLGRGAAVGELSLLTGSARSASVRAKRDSELLELRQDDFMEALEEDPSFSLGLARSLAGQLQQSRALAVESRPVPATIAVVPLVDGLPVRDLGAALIESLGRWSRTVRLDEAASGDGTSPASLLDRAERDAEQVLLVCSNPSFDDDWTAFCVRQADRVLAVVDGSGARPPASGLEAFAGAEVVFHGATAPTAVGPWLDAVNASGHHLLSEAPGRRDPIDRIARRLAGRAVGVVLSGGGARGFAHIGVLEALLDAGIVIDRIAGCSMGAFVGAQFAAGWSPSEIRARCEEEMVERNPLGDYTLPLVSLVRGRRGEAMLRRLFEGMLIEALGRQFFCVSSDLLSAELVVHRRGPLVEAVGASFCLPGIGPPVAYEDRLLVDGGVLNNLPVDVMAGSGEGLVIASDVSARFEPPAQRATVAVNRRARLRRFIHRAAVGDDVPRPSILETVVRSVALGSIDTAAAAEQFVDLVIAPEVAGVGLTAFDRLDDLIARGRRAGAAAAAAAQLLSGSRE